MGKDFSVKPMISSKWLFHAIFITQTMAVVRMWREPWGCLDGRGITEEHSAVLFFCPVSVLLSFSLMTSNTPDHDVFIFFSVPVTLGVGVRSVLFLCFC